MDYSPAPLSCLPPKFLNDTSMFIHLPHYYRDPYALTFFQLSFPLQPATTISLLVEDFATHKNPQIYAHPLTDYNASYTMATINA